MWRAVISCGCLLPSTAADSNRQTSSTKTRCSLPHSTSRRVPRPPLPKDDCARARRIGRDPGDGHAALLQQHRQPPQCSAPGGEQTGAMQSARAQGCQPLPSRRGGVVGRSGRLLPSVAIHGRDRLLRGRAETGAEAPPTAVPDGTRGPRARLDDDGARGLVPLLQRHVQNADLHAARKPHHPLQASTREHVLRACLAALSTDCFAHARQYRNVGRMMGWGGAGGESPALSSSRNLRGESMRGKRV